MRIGIDIGGTFTDFVIFDPGKGTLESFKLLSTPQDPSKVVLDGLEILFKKYGQQGVVVHGSTVATNALLERKGAECALITTRGFKDVLEIGRQNRPVLYDLFADPDPVLIPSELRLELDERVDHEGKILQPLNGAQVKELLAVIKDARIRSVAVCFLFSFLNKDHEALVTKILRDQGILVSASHEILPEFREYERVSTTVVNAYVSPIMENYLEKLEHTLTKKAPGISLQVMQSNGGIISPGEARKFAVRCILSGPAGGLVASTAIGKEAANDGDLQFITFDMGGTSTDVSLIKGKPEITSESIISGCPVRIPMLDIHTIGAGGGSIARVDEGGALRVGPESAGADPGPACYGRGYLATVTDANLVLGRITAEQFLGGKMKLDRSRAEKAMDDLAMKMGISRERAALGIIQVANAHMERALRLISVEKGHDPRDFSLLSFGGAGGLHAVDLARGLGIPKVLVPALASTFSAYGMLAADVVKDYTQTVMLPGHTSKQEIDRLMQPLMERGWIEIQQEGIEDNDIHTEPFLDIRYEGQSYELMIPLTTTFGEDFHSLHKEKYGYSHKESPVEIVNLRLRAVGKVPSPGRKANPMDSADASKAKMGDCDVIFEEGKQKVPMYKSESLKPGNRLEGPCLVIRNDTTVLLSSGDLAVVDVYDNILVDVRQ